VGFWFSWQWDFTTALKRSRSLPSHLILFALVLLFLIALGVVRKYVRPTYHLMWHLLVLTFKPGNLADKLRCPGVRAMQVFYVGTRFEQKLVLRWLKLCRFFSSIRFWIIFILVGFHRGWDVANVYRLARWGRGFNIFSANGEHVHPLPAAAEDELGDKVQTTTISTNTAAGSGLHDADSSTPLF